MQIAEYTKIADFKEKELDEGDMCGKQLHESIEFIPSRTGEGYANNHQN